MICACQLCLLLRRSSRLLSASAVVVVVAFMFAAEVACEENLLSVVRYDPVFREVLTDLPALRRVTSWHHDYLTASLPDSLRETYDETLWALELERYFDEVGAAGIDGPYAPWSVNRLGEELMMRLNRRYGMKYPYFIHNSTFSLRARENGAKYIWHNNHVAPWDPVYMDTAETIINEILSQYTGKPWLAEVIGRDEPFNFTTTVRNPSVIDSVNADIMKRYGLTIGLTPIDPAKEPSESPMPQDILDSHPLEIALLRIAAGRWMNDTYAVSMRRERDLVRRLAPGSEYHGYNRNAINICDFIDTRTRYSLDILDQSCYYGLTDCVSADPYATAPLVREGRARAIYHVGFITKLVTDLAAGTPSKIILQACSISGLFPHPDNLREWAGQAAKTGASHLEWYTAGAPRFIWRDGYREMLRVSRLWRDLPQLDIPSSSAIGVIFGDDARLGADDAALHPHYVMHALLGEKLGAWYTFIGENQVRKGQQSLDGKRLLIAPVLSFVSAEFSGILLDAVRAGATLVLLDPDAFRYDIETGTLEGVRMTVAGAQIGESRDVGFINQTPEGKKRFIVIDRLPVGKPKKGLSARTVIPPADARVLFVYDSGEPAVYSRRIGDGEVIVFAFQPFGDSEAAVEPSGWETFFASLIDEAGFERGLPLWRFELPETGGEIETSLPICLGGKR